LTKTVT